MPIACKLNEFSLASRDFFSRPTDFHALSLNREVNALATSLIEIELFLDCLLVRLETKTSLCFN